MNAFILSPQQTESRGDVYRSVVIVLTAAAALGTFSLAFGGLVLGNIVLLHAAVSLGLATGVLIGVAIAQAERAKPHRTDAQAAQTASDAGDIDRGEQTDSDSGSDGVPAPVPEPPTKPSSGLQRLLRMAPRLRDLRAARREPQGSGGDVLPFVLVALGVLGTIMAQAVGLVPQYAPSTTVAVLGTLACLGAAGLAATAVRYLSQIGSDDLPESAALTRGARVVMWVFGLAAVAVAVQWVDLGQSPTVLAALSVAIAAVNTAVWASLLMPAAESAPRRPFFDADFAVTRILGRRANVLASIMDSAQAQLGIDLRSTWALAIVRHSLEPLLIGLAVAGWLTTSLTVVGVDEQGLVERLGIPLGGEPLSPGLHVHLPWPIDQVFRIPVQRVQALAVGHEGEEGGGPENVLWAVEHAANEYTLLLGNGRDLVTIDAAVQFRIRDPREWFYASQNPVDSLRAIAYRAVMRTTVNQTLADVLSENVVTMTSRMRDMVQQDADALGIGVQVLNFTIGGMHPPVAVASDYQAVVSAELGKVTAVVSAQAERNRTVPYAESAVLVGNNAARAMGADALARAAGEAWSFRAIEAQYRTSPTEYFFRERLDALERVLSARRFTVLDERIQRDRGELWMTP